jgi:hypothetical protein
MHWIVQDAIVTALALGAAAVLVRRVGPGTRLCFLPDVVRARAGGPRKRGSARACDGAQARPRPRDGIAPGRCHQSRLNFGQVPVFRRRISFGCSYHHGVLTLHAGAPSGECPPGV